MSRGRRLAAGRAIVISSPSGGGKTTVVERLLKQIPRLARSVSVTTRAPRPGERPGRDYQFVTRAAFDRMRRSSALLEWARVHEAWYGTPKRPVAQALARGRDIVLCLDVQGGRSVRRLLGRRAVLVFLMPPSMARLRERLMRRRTEPLRVIRCRLAAAERELACAKWYDYHIVNDRLGRTVRELGAIIQTGVRRASAWRGRGRKEVRR